MTIISLLALFISIGAAVFIDFRRLTTNRLMSSLFLLLVHVGASVYYCQWTQSVVADASSYYFDQGNFGAGPWAFGSQFVVKFVHILKVDLGATYLDSFLFFQSFGFAGLMILARLFREIEEKVGIPEQRAYFLLLLLPSANFWTSAVGKDAPIFFSVALCVWSMMNFRPRFVAFCIGLAVMVCFRPYMALIAASALAGASFFGSNVSFGRRLGLLVVAVAGVWIASGAVESTFGVDATSVSSVSDYLEQQGAAFASDTGNTSLGDAPFAVKALSLLFRPLFFDAHGVLGVIASFENLGVVLLTLYLLAHVRDLAHLTRHVQFVRFAVVFAFLVLLTLTVVYYNVGLGLRERVMAYPMIFTIAVSVWSVQRKRRSMAPVMLRPGLAPNARTQQVNAEG